MFGRKKDETPAVAPEKEAHGSHVVRPGAKNRPTPKRREQEAARRQPVVDPNRSRATSRDRSMSREDAKNRQQAMLRGEEWALMDRDRGIFRRFARDYVDARFSIGELLMPLILVALVLSALINIWKSDAIFYAIMILTYGTFFAAILDAVLAYRRLKKTFVQVHPREEIPSGAGMYAGMRMMQIRRLRTPRPQVERGQLPR